MCVPVMGGFLYWVGCVCTCDGGLLVLGALEVLFHQLGGDTDDMLALPVLHHVERLQRADDVTLRDAGHLAVDGQTDKQQGPEVRNAVTTSIEINHLESMGIQQIR